MQRYVSAAMPRTSLIVCAAALLLALANVSYAQTVPAPWSASDIGAPALAGSTTYSSAVFTTSAGGTGLGGAVYGGPTDQFHFISQQVTGDAEIIARIESLASQG